MVEVIEVAFSRGYGSNDAASVELAHHYNR